MEINTTNIANNLKRVKAAVPSGTHIMAVVKADAYGHGAAPVAMISLEQGASFLGVALLEEGVALRRAGIAAPILFMGAFFPWQAPDLVRFGLTATVASVESAECLSDAAVASGRRARVHIKVDTGMGRIGLTPADIPGLVRRASRLPGIDIEGIFTHLACAECNQAMTLRQLEQFHDLTESLRAQGYFIPLRHAANSAAALAVPESALDMVRVGAALYGLSPTGATPPGPEWAQAMSFHTRVAYVKAVPANTTVSYGAAYVSRGPEVIATLPVGYADGYSRSLSGKAEVLLNGERRHVVGKVCMDQIMISLPLDAHVEVGDEVILMGCQGDDTIYAEDLARWTGSIGYEVVCGISKRVPRVYVGGRELEQQ